MSGLHRFGMTASTRLRIGAANWSNRRSPGLEEFPERVSASNFRAYRRGSLRACAGRGAISKSSILVHLCVRCGGKRTPNAGRESSRALPRSPEEETAARSREGLGILGDGGGGVTAGRSRFVPCPHPHLPWREVVVRQHGGLVGKAFCRTYQFRALSR